MLEKAKKILKTLNEHNYSAYLVGGCVRDILLNRSPSDYDVCTSATPDQIKELFTNNYPVGESFGVIKVNIDNSIFDVATYRSERDYSDGRRPETVKFETDPKEDVIRRDFTINGLLMDHNEKIYDFVGGEQDLKDKVIRCIGNPQERFSEDYLRILRAIRFSCQLEFSIDTDTLFAAKLLSSGLEKISKERVTEEFRKILTSYYPSAGFAQLKYINAVEFIIPELLDLVDCQQPSKYHNFDVYRHTFQMLKNSQKPLTFTLAMSILLHDIGKPRCKGITNSEISFHNHENVGAEMSDEICRSLKLSNDEREIIISHVKHHMELFQCTRMNRSTLKRLCRLLNFEELLELHRLDCLCAKGNMETYEFVSKFYQENKEQIRLKPLITGDDLIALGYKPGPQFKIILNAVETQQLNCELADKDSAITWIQTMFEVSE